jgi:hypothetical protein
MEVDVYGRRVNSACFNNQDFRNHLFGKIENYLKTYPGVDGIAWGCERMGPLGNTLQRDGLVASARTARQGVGNGASRSKERGAATWN